MEVETKKQLWEELKLLQVIVNKFDEFTFRIKNWFIITFTALNSYAVAHHRSQWVLLSLFTVPLFYVFEAMYRVPHGDFLERLREVEKYIRYNDEPPPGDMPPNTSKYLLQEKEPSGCFTRFIYRIQLDFNVEESRAKRNIREWGRMFSCKTFFQFRFTWPYLTALLVGLGIAILVA